MLYIFEMANNHQGSVEHAKKIIDEFSSLAKRMNINAAVKLQFRQLFPLLVLILKRLERYISFSNLTIEILPLCIVLANTHLQLRTQTSIE